MARPEPLSKTIINCAKEGIFVRITQPDGTIIEPSLTDTNFVASCANHEIEKINTIADQFRGLNRVSKRA